MINKKKVISINFEESISKAQDKISKYNESIIVLKDDKYFGILDARHISEHPVKDPSNTPCGSIAFRAPTIEEDTDIIETTKAFFSVRVSNLAIISKNEKILGIITRLGVLEELMKEKMIPKKRISEVMSSPIITIEENADVNLAITQMRKNGVRRLAVVNEQGYLRGILSTFDIGLKLIKPTERLPKLTSDKLKPWEQPIKQLIKRKIEIISPEKTLNEAVKRMIEKNVASLIVVKDKKPIGLISTKDVFETIMKSKKEETRIYISGLDRYDKSFYQEILDESKRVFDKLTKSNKDIGGLILHVKKYGNKYTVIARLEIGNKVIKTTGNEWNLPSAVNESLENLKRTVRKHGVNYHTSH
ncbi:MAG: CBS domain-containing protein [Candidatus Micrarchaeia archaeon]|jgi:predicted transcriptional regulator